MDRLSRDCHVGIEPLLQFGEAQRKSGECPSPAQVKVAVTYCHQLTQLPPGTLRQHSTGCWKARTCAWTQSERGVPRFF